jgi:DNA-binding Lrp family transcriptional regulator
MSRPTSLEDLVDKIGPPTHNLVHDPSPDPLDDLDVELLRKLVAEGQRAIRALSRELDRSEVEVNRELDSLRSHGYVKADGFLASATAEGRAALRTHDG